MQLHVWTQSTQRVGSLRIVNIKAFTHPRPTLCRSAIRLSFPSRNLASKSKRALPNKPKAGAYESPAGKLAVSSKPVLLYQATNTLPFTVGCYSIGFFLITCAIINNHTKIAAGKADVPGWVKVGTAFGQFAMVAYGSYMLMKPHNVIRSVKSIPSNVQGARSVQLQIERTRTIPFIKPKKYTVPSSDITTSAPLFLGPDEQIKAELKELRRQEKEYLQMNREISPRTWPFRVLGHWTSLFFGGCKRAFTMGGFINFHIKGRNFAWKMDTDSAWALEGGRSFDELVTIKQ